MKAIARDLITLLDKERNRFGLELLPGREYYTISLPSSLLLI